MTPRSNSHDSGPPAGAPKRRPLMRRLLGAGSLMAAGKLVATAAMLLNYRLIASRLPDEEVAAFLVVNGVAALGAIFAGLGLGPLMIRRVRAAELHGDRAGAAATLRRGLRIVAPAGLLAAAGVVVLLSVSPQLFGAGVAPYRYYAASWLVAALLCQFFGDAARGYERFGVAALVNSLNGGVLPNLFLTVYLLAGLPWWTSIDVVLAGQLIGLGLSAAVGWWAARPLAGGSPGPEAASADDAVRLDRPGATGAVDLLKESLPMLASQASVIGVTHVEVLLLGMYAAPEDVAAYGAVRRLMLLVGGPLLLLNASLPTFVVELYSQRQLVKLQQLLRGAATAAMAPAALLLAVMLAAPGRCLALFNPDYADAWPALVVFGLANLVFVTAGSCGLVLRMTGFEKAGMVSSLSTGALYLVVAPWAAANYALMGVAAVGAGLIVLRNSLGVVLVRRLVGLWCTPWFSPATIRSSIGLLTKRPPRAPEPAL